MKKTTRTLLLIVVAILLLAAFAGCQEQETPVANGSLQVNTIKFMPYAYLGESFDLRDVLLMEEGVEYSATACYVDVATLTEYPLEVIDLCFTPEAVTETVVILTATRGNESASKAVYIPTTIRAEPLDDLYKSSGELGGSDPGISKTVNIDPMFLQGDTSTTSLHVSFSSTDPHPYGNQFMNFSNEKAQEYFTDKVWENAVATFWVYNPNEKPIEFQFTIVDEQLGTYIDWQTADGPHKQFALPGQWTQLFFSMRKAGTTHRLTSGKYSNDYLSLKFRYEDYSTTEAYSFDFYIDNIDVVDGSVYPDVDTKFVLSNEDIEQGWENMAQDKGWQGVYTEYDYENFIGEGSTCALKAYFNSEKSLTNSFICLSPEAEFDTNPDMTGGKLSAYFKFENMDPKVQFDILNTKWETSNKIDFPLTAVGDDWYYGEIDLESVEVGSGRNDEIIRIRFHFSGVSIGSVVYMDTAIYEYKYVDKVLESVDADWINMAMDRGDYYWNVTSKYSTNYLKGSNTVRSMYVAAPANAQGKFTFTPASDMQPNMTNGTLGAWFYFGKQLPNATMKVTSDNWKGSVELPFVFTQNTGDGWYYGELHGSDIKFVESATASKIIRITILIPKGYTIYIDNLHWFAGVENDLVAAEIDPSVLYDGGDFLADTDSLSYDSHHWENVPNSDGKPDTQQGLTCGVDTTNVYGEYSVRSWYFKAAASNACTNAIAQMKFAKGYDMTDKLLAFDIRIDSDSKIQQSISMRLHTAAWSDINHINRSIKLNADETWKTVVLDFSDVYLDGADIKNLGMISFNFDFAANTGKDRAIYIDNVRLLKADQIPENAVTSDEIPEELDPSDMFDGGDLLANATAADTANFFNGSGDYIFDTNSDKIFTDNEIGQYSVKSVKFASVKVGDNYPTALLNLGRSVNMNGKYLAMDVFFENTKGTVAVYTLHNSNWSSLHTSEHAANYVVSGNSGSWNTFYIDISKTLAEGKDLSDVKFIKFQFFFNGTGGAEEAVYIDNVRLVDPASVPPMDDTSIDWTNMSQDKGAAFYHTMITNEFSNAHIKGEFSTKALHVVSPADAIGRFTLNPDYAVTKGELEKKPNMNAGILGAWFYFGDQIPSATLRIGEAGWDNSHELNFVFGEGEDGWYYGTVDCSAVTYPKTFYPGLTVRATISLPAGYDVYIDSMTFEAADIADPSEPAEDPNDLLGSAKSLQWNEAHWTPATGLIVKPNTENVFTAETASVRSMSFLASAAANLNRATAQFKLSEVMDMTGYNLAFDVLYDADTSVQQNIQIRLHSGADMTRDETVKVNPGEWKTVVVNFDDVLLEGKDYTGLDLISFHFDFAENTGVERAVYIDNVRFTKDEETLDDEPLPVDPSELIDGGDLLAGAKVEWNPSLWDGDPASVDSACTDVYTEGEMGAYSVSSWKFYTSQEGWSEGIQLKLSSTHSLVGKNIEMDVKFVNAKQTIGIELFNKWTALQPDSTSIAKVTGNGSEEWQTLVFPAEVLAEAIGDQAHDEIALIRFNFDFATGVSGEHAIIIDNVRFTKSDINEVNSDMLAKATVVTDDLLIVEQDTTNITGKKSLRSWAFKAGAAVDAEASAVFTLGKAQDLTGKYLVFDVKTDVEQKFSVTLLNEAEEALTNPMEIVASDSDWAVALVDPNADASSDISAVAAIRFTFDYAANTGADRNLFIDNVRLVDAETVDSDWIHMDKISSEGFSAGSFVLSGAQVYDESTASGLLTAPADSNGIVTLDVANALEKNLKHRGTLSGWFYFGEQAPEAYISTTDDAGNACNEAVAIAFGEGVKGWYQGSVVLSDLSYAADVTVGNISTISIVIPQGYVVYIDTIGYTDITEDVTVDLIHMPHKNGEISTEVVFGDESSQSLYVDATEKNVSVEFAPTEALNLTDTTIRAWFYFGENAPSRVRFQAKSGSKNTGYVEFTFSSESVNGWYLGEVSSDDVDASKQNALEAVNTIIIQVVKPAGVYIDCMEFVPNITEE